MPPERMERGAVGVVAGGYKAVRSWCLDGATFQATARWFPHPTTRER